MDDNMIEVRGAYKRYGKQPPVLRDLNMTVKKGTIYGLLGPSGCGKTTLLSCIVGKRHLDCGYVKLGITKRKHFGYMPQDIALFQEFTISEIFTFYGSLYGMTPGRVTKRADEISLMLEIPNRTRYIHSLSGGQQRRVSLAVALLHGPPLLILDEPTVGMDPILCNTIWEYLVKLAHDQRITIVITTHYIEEARQSNTIGLMRRGQLLSEESPKQLMESQNCNNLETAFLELSKKQHDLHKLEKQKGIRYTEYPTLTRNSSPLPLESDEWFSFPRFLAQLTKNIKWTQRNIGILLFILLLPSLQSYFFCASFGRDPAHLPFAVVSDELNGFVKSCDELPYNETYSPLLECNVPKSFSCQFMKQLGRKLDVILYENLDVAKNDAKKNAVWGVLHVSKNFTSSIEERISEGISTTEVAIDQSAISVWMDMSNFIIANIIRRNIAKSLIDFLQDVMEACGIPRKVGDIPISFNEALYGSNEPVYRHSSAAGFICAFVFYFTMTFTSGAIMMEKMYGLLDRIMVAGLTKAEIVCAHLIVQFVLMTAQTSLMLLVLYRFYDNPLHGDFGLTVSLLYIIAIVGIAFGYFLTELLNEERLISYAGIGMVMTMFLINGTVWPMEGAHDLMKVWTRAFPIVAAAESYNSITSRGYDITHQDVYMGFVSCLAWTTFFSLTTYWITRRNKGS
ncbi:ATP-Hypothetical protein cassette sub-family A ABC1 member [Nesidiocoris tenuis]|uniref:ABC transporter domain-containing protein n=1 Tax=Nesidiocoris tenuis TaxID=355587 RepID=A0ABN7B346_9HEMI|nr:ATP-Hypothetical protein cassette sub-family A ABC1 member [Nesidiocoris tenuis]